MAYVRGKDSLEVEVSRIQSWVEAADVELYGRNWLTSVIAYWMTDNLKSSGRRRRWQL